MDEAPFSMSGGQFLRSQWTKLKVPDDDCSGKVVIVTGANSGIGREAARHFVRLGAAKVILAVRNVAAGEVAQASIEQSSGCADGTVQVWPIDLASSQSIVDFAARVDRELDRLDVLVNNASVHSPQWKTVEGWEIQTKVNVISPLMLTLLLLRKLKETATEHEGVVPRVVTVASDGAYVTEFSERKEPSIFQALNSTSTGLDRYNCTKLLVAMCIHELALTYNNAAVATPGKENYPKIIFNAPHPGFCRTDLFRNWFTPLRQIVSAVAWILGRSPEEGSRTILHAAFAGEETQGRILMDNEPRGFPALMLGEEGVQLGKRVWEELLEELERIHPGIGKLI